MGKKQTAVQFLQQEIKKYSGGSFIVLGLSKEFEQAIQMEREQIDEAWRDGGKMISSAKNAEQYYNQTFNS